MTYRGKLCGGVVVLEPHVQLPDGLDVLVQPVQAQCVQTAAPQSPAIVRNGVPVFPRRDSASAPGLDLVNQLRDDTP